MRRLLSVSSSQSCRADTHLLAAFWNQEKFPASYLLQGLVPTSFVIANRLTPCSYRYPAQQNVGGDAKIPTAIYYDTDGNPRAFGAETLTPNIEAEAEEKGWVKAHWCELNHSWFLP